MNPKFPFRMPAVVLFTSTAFGQQPARPEFEVASVKPNLSGAPGFSIQALPAGLRARETSA
jgi:hypothetical protein